MGRGVQHHSTYQSRPECELTSQVKGKVKESKLVALMGRLKQFGPTARKMTHKDRQGNNSTDDVNTELNDIGPDHRLHPTDERINHGDRCHGYNGRFGRPPRQVLEDGRREKEPESVA